MMLNFPRTSTMYAIPGTKIFRLGSKKIIRLFGENVQNKDKSVRHLFLSDGWEKSEVIKLQEYLTTGDISIFNEEELNRIKILVQVDESGADALIVAYLCRPGKFRDLFIHGIKPHVFVSLHLFADEWKKRIDKQELDLDKFLHAEPKDLKLIEGWKRVDSLIKSSDDWIPSERFYYMSKKTCHSANYDVRGPTFALSVLTDSEGAIRLSVAQAKHYLEFYHRLFPEIRQWHNEIQNMLNKQHSVLYNLFNEPRQFNGMWGDELFREAYAFIPASTVGQIINKAKTKIQMLIEEDDLTGVDLLQNGHDSCLAQCLIGQENFISSVLQEFINVKLVNFRGESFSMKSEAQRGFNWAPAKFDKTGKNIIKNHLGLRTI